MKPVVVEGIPGIEATRIKSYRRLFHNGFPLRNRSPESIKVWYSKAQCIPELLGFGQSRPFGCVKENLKRFTRHTVPQRAQYPLIKEYTLSYSRIPKI